MFWFTAGPTQSRGDIKLQPGDYNFPFQFRLPPRGLPTSFEGEHGSVRYWLGALVPRYGWKSTLEAGIALHIAERVEIREPRCLVSMARTLSRIQYFVLFGARRPKRLHYLSSREGGGGGKLPLLHDS